MHLLIRIFIGLFFVWSICKFFYSLGRKSALNEKKNNSNRQIKEVKSTVVEKQKENETDKDF